MKTQEQQTAESEKEVVTTLQKLIIGNSPEELEDMIFHVFEDANLQAGDLSPEEKLLRYEFHVASRKILRILCRNPQLLKKFKDG
jgi:hypothetical protein